MKKLLIAMLLMVTMLTACGSEEPVEKEEAAVVVQETPAPTPEAEATPEPTATPVPEVYTVTLNSKVLTGTLDEIIAELPMIDGKYQIVCDTAAGPMEILINSDNIRSTVLDEIKRQEAAVVAQSESAAAEAAAQAQAELEAKAAEEAAAAEAERKAVLAPALIEEASKIAEGGLAANLVAKHGAYEVVYYSKLTDGDGAIKDIIIHFTEADKVYLVSDAGSVFLEIIEGVPTLEHVSEQYTDLGFGAITWESIK